MKYKVTNDFKIIYAKDDWEPPSVPKGWKRLTKDLRSEGAWTLIPLFKPCEHRVIRFFEKKTCGCVDAKIRCNKIGQDVEGYKCCNCDL